MKKKKKGKGEGSMRSTEDLDLLQRTTATTI